MYRYGYMDMDMDMDMDVDMDMDMDIDVYHRPNLERACNVGCRLFWYGLDIRQMVTGCDVILIR